MIVDFHSHFYPKAYLEELERESGFARIQRDERGRLIIHYRGDYNIVVKEHTDIPQRLKALDVYGIDLQVLTLTTPGVERESSDRGRELARCTNDAFGEIIEGYPDRFTAMAALPLQEPIEAAAELERAVRECGLRGGMVMSNVNGEPLDSEKFFPIYEMAVKLDVPLYIHPTSPINQNAMEDYRLVPLLGFCVDTTLAVLRLLFSGVLERFPQLKLVASHMGGVFPYLRGRVERGFHVYPECRVALSNPPSTYLRRIWMDSLCYDQDILMSVYTFSGADKILLGSDYPHQIGDLAHAVERIMNLDIGEEERNMILGENALKLLKL